MNQTNGGGDGRYAHDSRQCGGGKETGGEQAAAQTKLCWVVEGGEGRSVRCVVNAVVVLVQIKVEIR